MNPAKPSSDSTLVQLRTKKPERAMNVELPDGLTIPLDRRDFLRIGAVAAAAAGLAGASGCAAPPEQILPVPVRPEEQRPGKPLQYTGVCQACPAGCGVLATTREGRVIKIEGNPAHPVNQGAVCARGQAAVLDLYDPDRARQSMRVARSRQVASALSPDAVDQEIAALLRKALGAGTVRLLTGAVTGPAMRALVDAFLALFPGSEHVAWEPLSPAAETVAEAFYRCFGERIVPAFRLDKASIVVSFGSEFLDTFLSPVQFAKQFGQRRNPDQQMSRLWAFEGRMSLTGSNADRRLRVRPSHLPDIALAIAHELIVVMKKGAIASDSEIVEALGKYAIDQVSPSVGVSRETLKEVVKDLAEAPGTSLAIGGGPASTGAHGLALEIAINLINAALGNIGITVDPNVPSNQLPGRNGDLQRLAHEMRTGQVEVLLVAGSNPVYSAPAVFGFAEAMSHVPTVIAIADRIDETTRLSDLLCATAHPLESWSDAEPVRGAVCVSQPAMRPLGEMQSLSDLLVR